MSNGFFFEILVKITQCKSSKGIFPYSDQAIVTVRMVNLHNFPKLEMHPIFSRNFQLFSKDAKNAQASASKTGSFSRTLSPPQPLWTLPSFLQPTWSPLSFLQPPGRLWPSEAPCLSLAFLQPSSSPLSLLQPSPLFPYLILLHLIQAHKFL